MSAERISTRIRNKANQLLFHVNYSRIKSNSFHHTYITSDDGKRYFCYIDDNNDIQAMTYQDMLDSLVRPVIDELTNGQILMQTKQVVIL